VRLGRLKALKARDDAMQAVLAETAAKLPSLTQGSGYAALLEGLVLEGLIALAEPKVTVKGVAGQGSVGSKAASAAAIKYKDWATKNKSAAYASGIEVTWDPTPLTGGIGGIEMYGFNGKISLTNTLQSRLMLAYETRLPKLRAALFA
jgi:V-type H+-transporting ATPase subunit E